MSHWRVSVLVWCCHSRTVWILHRIISLPRELVVSSLFSCIVPQSRWVTSQFIRGKKQNHIAARKMTFSPHNPKKTISQAAICFFLREAHTCRVRKVPPSHYLFYKTKCNNAAHNTTTHKTKRNSTQDQTQQHTPLLNYGECFHVEATSELRKQLLLNDAGTNDCHRQLANRCAKSCWIELDWQFEKIC
jgi:hypothetical protein